MTKQTAFDQDFVDETILPLIQRGALFVVNHSGGKDSQAMYGVLKGLVPARQMLVLHAELPEVDWDGLADHIRENVSEIHDLQFCRAKKTFMEMVEHRQMFPSPKYRQCTSDLKRNPIEKAVRHYLKAHPEFNGLVVNCTGIRAEESANRSKAQAWKYSTKNSKAGREWYEWLPIHAMLEPEVWDWIEGTGQKRHWAYDAGMSRLSCCFCIMSSQRDLEIAAELNPELYARIVATEKRIGHTMMMPRKGQTPRTLDEIVRIPLTNIAA